MLVVGVAVGVRVVAAILLGQPSLTAVTEDAPTTLIASPTSATRVFLVGTPPLRLLSLLPHALLCCGSSSFSEEEEAVVDAALLRLLLLADPAAAAVREDVVAVRATSVRFIPPPTPPNTAPIISIAGGGETEEGVKNAVDEETASSSFASWEDSSCNAATPCPSADVDDGDDAIGTAATLFATALATMDARTNEMSLRPLPLLPPPL